MQRHSQHAALGAAAALFYVFLWASAYVPSKTGVLNSSPLWFLVVRFAVSGGVFLIVALALGGRLPKTPRDWLAIIVLGVTSNAVYLGCTYEALRHMAAGIGAIVASTNPLVLAFVAPFLLRERLTPLKISGLVMGFGGVVAIMIVRTGTGSAQPADVLLAFIGVLGSVAGTIVFKKYCGDFDLRRNIAATSICASSRRCNWWLPASCSYRSPSFSKARRTRFGARRSSNRSSTS